MALNIQKAAERHASVAKSVIRASSVVLDITVPGTRPTATGATLFSDLTVTQPAPVVHAGIKCLWHDSAALPRADAFTMQILGEYPQATAVATVILADVLTDPNDVYSLTYFDQATYVSHGGNKYNVLKVARTGLANVEPYLLMVVLAGEVL